MISELRLENYRGFEAHTVPFSELTVLVGRNNAGKSTAVEALRIVGSVVQRFRSSGAFADVPLWLDDPRAYRGVQPAVRDIEFDERSFFHAYGEAPAVVTATFSNQTSVNVFIGPFGDIHGVARGSDGHAVGNAAQARALGLPDLRVQPQIGPLLREETILARSTVVRNLGSSPSIHFRNQLHLFYDEFPEFKQFAEDTWPEIQIRELDGRDGSHGDILQLLIRDGPFTADVGLMGHGLQMWLQTIWFLSRAPSEACVVLDEPDVYMHPDLQHRLLLKLDGLFHQVILATHSVEIISTTDPTSLVVVDKTRARSRPLSSVEAAQGVIESLGGVHNVHVARLFRSDRFLMIEGDDVPLLASLQSVAEPGSRAPISTLPAYETGGWGGWYHATRSKIPRKSGEGKSIETYCFFDSDYHAAEEIEERYAEADAVKVHLHVWQRKELENYVLVPTAIARLINRRTRTKKKRRATEQQVEEQLLALADAMLDDTIDSLAEELQRRQRRLGLKGARRLAKERIETRIASHGVLAVVPGKAVVSALSNWSNERWGVPFSTVTLARELQVGELPDELLEVFASIEAKRAFPARLRPPPSAT